MKNPIRTTLEFFELLKKRLFYILASVVVIGEVSDLFLITHPPVITITNIIVASIVFIVIILFYYRVINLRAANFIVVYLLLFNLVFSPYFSLSQPDIVIRLLRISIFANTLILMAGFIINKNHSLVIGAIYYINFGVMFFLIKDKHLFTVFSTIIIVSVGFIIGVYYMINVLVNALYEQKRLLKESFKMNDKLQYANESKQKMLSMVSHDLRGPFSTILGFIDLLEHKVEKNDKDAIVKYLTALRDSANNSYFLLVNLLDWTKMEQGKMIFKPEECEINEILNPIIELTRYEMEHKNITLLYDVPENIIIHADKNMLSSLFRNLLTNAVKFTLSGRAIGS